ncbi:hypothetical protein PoB_005018800 [Plakobranchus ocellatus]|uniref:Chitin-binding type-4 domain-containing protein n=1 Tax=Plakobranchus ocellatus TaxID=259542 RepID=A0AAV4BY03_9GAST|nr:hypothetical protein PoB_005018800 [Plakobranchus ocellatus]
MERRKTSYVSDIQNETMTESRHSGLNLTSALTSSVLVVLLLVVGVKGHGRLLEPPSRGSMWRLGYPAPVNYNDNQLFCGGVGVQYGVNGGKCGVCGDPWNSKREHEAGGKYANGVIVRKYAVGQVINATVELTANHKGFFEFHLCPTDNPFKKVSHMCLQKFPLFISNTDSTRFDVPTSELGYKHKRITVPLRLPVDVKCRACLLQWQYTAGNSWGVSPDGRQCVGCGDQEQFYGCADIAIGHDDVVLGKPTPKHPWYFQTEEEKEQWHYGVVRFIGGSSAGVKLADSFRMVSALRLWTLWDLVLFNWIASYLATSAISL